MDFEVYRKGSCEGMSLAQKTVWGGQHECLYLPLYQRITENNGNWNDFLTVIMNDRVGTGTQVSPQ